MTAEKYLLEVARKLPAERIREVVDFAEFLLARPRGRAANSVTRGQNALRRYVGGVKHGRLTAGIDEELYGRAVR